MKVATLPLQAKDGLPKHWTPKALESEGRKCKKIGWNPRCVGGTCDFRKMARDGYSSTEPSSKVMKRKVFPGDLMSLSFMEY